MRKEDSQYGRFFCMHSFVLPNCEKEIFFARFYRMLAEGMAKKFKKTQIFLKWIAMGIVPDC